MFYFRSPFVHMDVFIPRDSEKGGGTRNGF